MSPELHDAFITAGKIIGLLGLSAVALVLAGLAIRLGLSWLFWSFVAPTIRKDDK